MHCDKDDGRCVGKTKEGSCDCNNIVHEKQCCDNDNSITETTPKIGNPNYISNKELILLLQKNFGIELPDDSKQNLILFHCMRVGALSQEEWKKLLKSYSIVKCHLQTSVKDDKMLDSIDKIISIASKFNALGSRLLNAWIKECYEIGDPKNIFDRTIGNKVFMKDIFRCARRQKGTADLLLTESVSFAKCSHLAPSLDEMTDVLTLDAWGNIFNDLSLTYITNLHQHVTRHINTRLCSHLKRLLIKMKATLKKVNHQTMVCGIENTEDFTLSSVYDDIGEEKIKERFPERLKEEFEFLKRIAGNSWTTLKKTKNKEQEVEIKFNRLLFDLHLYLQSVIPLPEKTDSEEKKQEDKEKTRYDPSEITMEKNDEEIKYVFTGKGFTPAPITKLGRVFVTIDNKVLDALKKKGVVEESSNIETAFNVSKKDLKQRKKELRKKLRKLKDNKKRRRSLRKNGCGSFSQNGKVTSILTDGVSLCIRYCNFDLDREKWLKAWDGVYSKDKKKEDEKKTIHQLSTEKAKAHYDKLVRLGIVRLIAIDPGREEIFHSASRVDGKFEEHRFKRSKYIEVSLRNKVTEFNEKIKTKEIRQIEGLLSKNGGWKARTKEDYAIVFDIWCKEEVASMMIQHYCNKEFALWKMRLYRRKQSILIQRMRQMIGDTYVYVDGIKKKVCLIIGYGAAKIGMAGKGEVAVPTAKNAMLLRKYLRSRNIPSAVIEVWEYLTSQMCHKCQQRMCSFMEKGRTIRGLKLCTSSQCSTKTNPAFRNRDGNAARNILECLKAMVLGEARPQYLCRQINTDKVVKTRAPRAKRQKKVSANP